MGCVQIYGPLDTGLRIPSDRGCNSEDPQGNLSPVVGRSVGLAGQETAGNRQVKLDRLVRALPWTY